MPSEIGVYRHIEHDRTGQLARPYSIERLGEERHAAGDRSELFAGRVVLTLVGLQGLTRRGLHRWLLPEEEGSHDDEDDPRPYPRYGRQYRRH
jgi:hypothetical protein